MKLSELIQELQKGIEHLGDIELYTESCIVATDVLIYTPDSYPRLQLVSADDVAAYVKQDGVEKY